MNKPERFVQIAVIPAESEDHVPLLIALTADGEIWMSHVHDSEESWRRYTSLNDYRKSQERKANPTL